MSRRDRSVVIVSACLVALLALVEAARSLVLPIVILDEGPSFSPPSGWCMNAWVGNASLVEWEGIGLWKMECAGEARLEEDGIRIPRGSGDELGRATLCFRAPNSCVQGERLHVASARMRLNGFPWPVPLLLSRSAVCPKLPDVENPGWDLLEAMRASERAPMRTRLDVIARDRGMDEWDLSSLKADLYSARDAVEAVRGGLQKRESAVLPIPGSHMSIDFMNRMEKLNRLLASWGWLFATEREWGEAGKAFLESLRFSVLVANARTDAGATFSNYVLGVGMARPAIRGFETLARKAPGNPEILEEVGGVLRAAHDVVEWGFDPSGVVESEAQQFARSFATLKLGSPAPFLHEVAYRAGLARGWARVARSVASSADRARARVRLCRVALALRSHLAAAGGYPASLDALVPMWLDDIPMDPFLVSEPLGYRSDGSEGFVLWSAGDDRKDDAGSPESDIVWDWEREIATPAPGVTRPGS